MLKPAWEAGVAKVCDLIEAIISEGSIPTSWKDSYIWASMRENLSSVVCKQQRGRPACASAQSDQRLCYSLFGKFHMWTCYRWNLNFLASLCSWGDWLETSYIGNPEDRFCHMEAHIQAWTKGMIWTLETPVV